MTRILLVLLLTLTAQMASAVGVWSPTSISGGTGQNTSRFTFNGTDVGNAQPALGSVPGPLSVTAEIGASAVSVAFYSCPPSGNASQTSGGSGSDNPAVDCTLLATITADSRTPTYLDLGPGQVLDGDIDTDGDGGVIYVAAAGLARYFVPRATPGSFSGGSVALNPGNCSGNVITVGGVASQVLTLPGNPSPGLFCRFLVTGNRSVTIDVQGATGCVVGATCDRISSHANLGGDRVSSPAFTAFGDSLDCLAVDADSWQCRDAQGAWEDVN